MTEIFSAASASLTHKGNVREINEDSCLELPAKGLWVVADGMGGHAAGDVASRMIIDSLRRIERHDRPSAIVDELEDTLLAVNSRLYAKARESEVPTVIGSTVVSLVAFPAHCVLAWAGDSRVYRLRDGLFEQLTRDHSVVQGMVERGDLQADQAEQHASANEITRAVGGDSELYLDFDICELADGDRYLLCSDGLYKDLNLADIAAHLGPGEVADACDALVAAALEREGGDNLTVIVVDFCLQGSS